MDAPEKGTGDQAVVHPWSPGKGLKALPRQYLNTYIHPSVATFAEAIHKADWVVNAIEILFYTIVVLQMQHLIVMWLYLHAISLSYLDLLWVATNLLPLVLPIGAIWGLVILFGGTGSMREHCHVLLLIAIPFGLLLLLLDLLINHILIFVSTAFVSLNYIIIFFGIYCIFLQVLAVKAVHKLSTGKAIASVLIGDVIAFFVFGIVQYFLFPPL